MTDPSELTFPDAPRAYDAVLGTLKAIRAEEVVAFRTLVPRAVANALAVAGAYAEDRDRFTRTFTKEGFDAEQFDDLSLRAQGLWHAEQLLTVVLDPTGRIPPLIAEAEPLRKKLLKAARYLWEDEDGLGPIVAAITSGRGHLDTADDLGALSSLFTSQWAGAESRSNITREDVSRAGNLSVELLGALAPKSPPQKLTAARDIRDRAGVHLRKGIDEVRAAAEFVLRHTPEQMSRYPALFLRPGAGRPKKTAKTTPASTEEPG